MSFTFYLALTLTKIRNQVAKPTSRASVPASQLAKQPASRPAGQNLSQLEVQPAVSRPAGQDLSQLKAQPDSQPASQRSSRAAGWPASQKVRQGKGIQAGRPKPKLSPDGRPAGRSSYTRLAGRPAGINTDWPAGRARNSRPSSPHSLISYN
jgi:hypothetical protein